MTAIKTDIGPQTQAQSMPHSASARVPATDVWSAINLVKAALDTLAGSLPGTYQPLDADLTAIAALTTTSYGRALLTLANAAALAAEVDTYFLTPAEGNAAYQPLDGDLTSIAALTTTSYGRSLLTLANATALANEVDSFFLTPSEGNAAYQPLDSDLTAIAALTTTSFGRSVLTQADAAALRTLAGLVIGTNVQAYDADLAAIAALTTTSFGRALLELANTAALRTAVGVPTSTTDNTLPRFDGTAGALQTSGLVVDDSNNVSGVNNISASGYLDVPEISLPSNPSANRLRFYSRDNGSGVTKAYVLDNAGTETELGSGGGSSAVLTELLTTVSVIALKQADAENVAAFLGVSGNRVADSFDALTYVNTSGATNLDTSSAGALKATVAAGAQTTIDAPAGTSSNLGNFTYFSRTAAVANSVTIYSVGVYSTVGGAFTLKIGKENSTTNFDVVVSQSFTHAGGGWQDVVLSSPYAVPASGTYRLGNHFNGSTSLTSNSISSVYISGNQGVATGVSATLQTGATPPLRYNVTAPGNMTVRSKDYVAASAPTRMKGLLLVREVEAATAGTDYTLKLSRDGGTTLATATLTELYSMPTAAEGTLRVVETNEIDVSGQPSGTSPIWEFATLNNKNVELRAAHTLWW